MNWYALERKQLGRIARLVAARNWFAAPVHRLNKCLYGGGFQLKDAAAHKWAAEGTYPFKRIHDDILHEYLISGSALAFWRTDAGPSELPMIEVPDMENVDHWRQPEGWRRPLRAWVLEGRLREVRAWRYTRSAPCP